MPVALKNKIDLISVDFMNELDDYVEYLIFKSQKKAETPQKSYGRKFGIAKTPDYWIAPDFDKTPEDFKEYM